MSLEVTEIHRQGCTGRAEQGRMVRVDEHGRWKAATRPRSVQVEQDASAAYARQLETIEAERAAYRAGTTSSWSAGRARAIKAAKAREKAWWDNLSPAARADRAETKRLEFDQMSITDQAALKARLAERRIRAGIDELETYQTWLRTVPADDLVTRSLERKQRFKDLSPAERGASVAAWDRHRLRYGLTAQRFGTPGVDQRPTRPDVEQAALLPDGAAARDAAFLERQGNLLEQDPRRRPASQTGCASVSGAARALQSRHFCHRASWPVGTGRTVNTRRADIRSVGESPVVADIRRETGDREAKPPVAGGLDVAAVDELLTWTTHRRGWHTELRSDPRPLHRTVPQRGHGGQEPSLLRRGTVQTCAEQTPHAVLDLLLSAPDMADRDRAPRRGPCHLPRRITDQLDLVRIAGRQLDRRHDRFVGPGDLVVFGWHPDRLGHGNVAQQSQLDEPGPLTERCGLGHRGWQRGQPRGDDRDRCRIGSSVEVLEPDQQALPVPQLGFLELVDEDDEPLASWLRANLPASSRSSSSIAAPGGTLSSSADRVAPTFIPGIPNSTWIWSSRCNRAFDRSPKDRSLTATLSACARSGDIGRSSRPVTQAVRNPSAIASRWAIRSNDVFPRPRGA